MNELKLQALKKAIRDLIDGMAEVAVDEQESMHLVFKSDSDAKYVYREFVRGKVPTLYARFVGKRTRVARDCNEIFIHTIR